MSARHPLPAARHPIAARLLGDPAAVAGVIERFGSPIHVVFPQVMAENAAALTAVLDRHEVPHEIFYAHKVNASTRFLAQACAAGLGVDVASAAELDRALAAGFAPDRIEATGPKSPALIERIAALGVTANADDLWELDRLAAVAPRGSSVPVLLRLSGFASPLVPLSRFGIDLADVDAALETVRRARGLELRGVAFHLDTADPTARVDALTESMTVVAAAYGKGLRPSVVDIGGGFRQRFVDDPEPFQRYSQALATAAPEELVWPGYDLAAPTAHKYGNHRPATDVLERFLTAEIERRPVAEVLRECMLTLWLEPGKALVDHAGITLASVLYRKRAAGRDLVVVDLSRNQVTPADQEVLVDPVLVNGTGDRPGEGVFLAGRLCLESDLISRRKVFLESEPRSGDVLAFVNTAAYQMDLSASSAGGHPPPPKVAAFLEGERFTFVPDDIHGS
ncbi:alanine racemase [Nocardioides sp.]|uniref:alanine racemase n=1 Tax=Nocardioides sp. TaxID=35761 RepID=UPI0019833149|nr:alanine racemase [Nocardioides sp.]MBC7275701.1 alanine racemase [Nocardioides sp.]